MADIERRVRDYMMGDTDRHAYEIDEYLWPLTGGAWTVDWESLNEELQIRQRLAEILSHVREVHFTPRLRRLRAGAAANVVAAVTESVVEGPPDGPVWAQTLREPVPRALRDEWRQLARRLHNIAQSRDDRATAEQGTSR